MNQAPTPTPPDDRAASERQLPLGTRVLRAVREAVQRVDPSIDGAKALALADAAVAAYLEETAKP